MGKLLSIEICNFKSYKGKQVIVFAPDNAYFTSVIGPNGGGKSNLMDAISFVLGVNARDLRSQKIKHLIYRGRIMKNAESQSQNVTNGSAITETNEQQEEQEQEQNQDQDQDQDHDQDQNQNQEDNSISQSDPKYAYVEATYKMADDTVIKLRRTASTTASTEYRLNNKVVPFSEYSKALESQNILVKARNFLVFQGDVEAVASQSPKDLSKLIEQISGSSEYKAEYDRLKNEQDSADVQAAQAFSKKRTLYGDIKQLTSQEQEYNLFKSLLDERDKCIIEKHLWNLYHSEQSITNKKNQLTDLIKKLDEARDALEKSSNELRKAKAAVATVELEKTKSQSQLNNLTSKLKNKSNSLIPAEEKISSLQETYEKLKSRLKEVEMEYNQRKSEFDQRLINLQNVDKEFASFEQDTRTSARKSGQTLTGEELEEYNELKNQVSENTATLKSNLNSFNREKQLKNDVISALTSSSNEKKQRIEEIDKESNSLKDQIDEYTSKVSQSKKDIESYKSKLSNLQKKQADKHSKEESLNLKLLEVIKQINSHTQTRNESERERKLNEVINQLKHLYPSTVLGKVSDLVRPKKKIYEVAVSVVLGRNFDAIIVDSQSTATECITYMREQRAGVATFIPLDSISAPQINPAFRSLYRTPGYEDTKLAIDTIEFDSKFENAIAYACNNAIICPDLEVAREIRWKSKMDVKVVTLSGSIIHKSGLMTGGVNDESRAAAVGGNNSTEIISKFEANEVRKLNSLKDNLLRELEELNLQPDFFSKIETLNQQIMESDSINKINLTTLSNLKRSYELLREEHEILEKDLNLLIPKLELENQTLLELSKSIDSTIENIEKIEDQVFEKFVKKIKVSTIREYENNQGFLMQRITEKRRDLTKRRAKLNSEIRLDKEMISEYRKRLDKLESSFQKASKDLDKTKMEKDKINYEIESIEKALEEQKEKIAEYDASLSKRNETMQGLKKSNNDLKESYLSTQESIGTLEQDIDKAASDWFITLRNCKLENIKIPLLAGNLDSIPMERVLPSSENDGKESDDEDGDLMDVDDDESTQARLRKAINMTLDDYGIKVDYSNLPSEYKEGNLKGIEERFSNALSRINSRLDIINPNSRSIDKLKNARTKLKEAENEANKMRKHSREIKAKFHEVREKRFSAFNKAFEHISNKIDTIYKELTMSSSFPLGGSAYLNLDNEEEPYLEGVKYYAIPPMKRFRDMEQLSGGEKTMAALALLFAIHSYHPSPFFVLDEIDAALDNTNVLHIAKYIKSHAGPNFQFIVISHKPRLFQNSHALVGVYRAQIENSSRVLTLDLRKYSDEEKKSSTMVVES